MPRFQFEKGKQYTRPEIAAQIDMPGERQGGNWHTGYDTWQDEVFVFCTVGAPGRTGHDYPNKWVADELDWSGKTGTHRNQPLIKKMTTGGVPVHIFWRRKDSDPFTYAGVGEPVLVRDVSPVTVRWRFPR